MSKLLEQLDMPYPSNKQAAPDPIAIVGIGCRFPGGVTDAETYWDMLISGRDGIVEVPKDRWNLSRFYDPDPARPGKTYVKRGGFIDRRLEEFDAAFFGISPREADTIDPQQRLLLEVTWEAFEDAGIVPEALAGSDAGVYIGCFTMDSHNTQLNPLNRHIINSHTATANTMTLQSNRLSYLFDLRGPSITVDTACSSSLVAFHYACQSIWNGECSLALAGGVNIMFRPEYPITMAKGQFLAPDGYCKSFDERANGYARSEGAGIVVLKPLSAARQDGDRIYAVARGTGVNQDGKTNGITVPNPKSQAALIRRVLDQANLGAHRIRYVEAHGTGTAVGDPIEAQALGTVLGKERPESAPPLIIGSVKANIGHLEAAAGIAGVIKATLCLQHGQIPPQANLQRLNPAIPFDDLRLKVPRQVETLPEGEGLPCAAVNSFGYGGTNAHAILEQTSTSLNIHQTSAAKEEAAAPERPFLLPLSARDPAALVALVRHYQQLLGQNLAPALADVCHCAALRRSHHEHRAVFVAKTTVDMAEQLTTFAEQGGGAPFITGRAGKGQTIHPVFVFTGMGPQWWAMGHELLAREPLFRETAEACDAAFQAAAGWSILAEMTADQQASRMADTQIAQPANVLLQIALTTLWRAWGVEPAAIVGHSVGEVGAAFAAGVLSLDQAMTVAYHRSRVQKMAAGKGKMLALAVPPAQAQELINGRTHAISIAAINGPATVTVAGDPEPLEAIAAWAESSGVFHRFLQVEVAYHSPHMEPLQKMLFTALQDLKPALPTAPLYSTVTGKRIEEYGFDAEYWCQNMRQTVRFADTMANLIAAGYRLFLEVGPHPVLATSIKECFRHQGITGEVYASLRQQAPEQQTLLQAAAALHVAGCPLDWNNLLPGGGRFIRLPTYPWQRQHYWHESEESRLDRLGCDTHPLLGKPLNKPGLGWEDDLCRSRVPYIEDHRIDGAMVFPGAGYAEVGLAIHRFLGKTNDCLVENLRFLKGLVIDPYDYPRFRVEYDEPSREYSIYSRLVSDSSKWQCHAQGQLSFGRFTRSAAIDLAAIRQRCHQMVETEELYRYLEERGLEYHPMFRTIRHLWRSTGEVLAEVAMTVDSTTDADHYYRLHPTLLDGCFQALIAALDAEQDTADNRVYVPIRIRQIRFYAPPTGTLWSHGQLMRRTANRIEGDITLCNESGVVLAEVRGLQCQALARANAENQTAAQRWTYEVDWEESPLPDLDSAAGKWLLFHDTKGIADVLATELTARGAEVVTVRTGACFKRIDPGQWQIRISEPNDLYAFFEETRQDYRAVVDLRGLDVTSTDADPIGGEAVTATLYLIQALAHSHQPTLPRLYLVTCGAQQVHAGEPLTAPAQAPIIGLGRVAGTEHPDLRCTLIDLGSSGIDEIEQQLQTLVAELVADSSATEIALRGGQRYIQRLTARSLDKTDVHQEPTAKVPAEEPVTLEIGRPGTLEGLCFRKTERHEPGPGEVELEVHAVALNFKDVLKTMGMIAKEALENTYYGNGLGMEAAGVITRIGPDVKTLRPGMEVVALLPNSFSSYVTVPADSLYWVPKLPGMNHEQSASLPLTFVTAWYGLYELARLQPGEKVLIHGGAGGIGQAAIQIARWMGAEIFATAGTVEKRELLSNQGVAHVMDSRSIDFADEVQSVTDGRGVDVVLNSLAGEVTLKSIGLLAPWGRFIEIGKRDFVDNMRLEMRPFNRALSYFAVDIDRMMTERPNLFRHLLREVWNRFAAGVLTAPPMTVFPVDQTVDAFRHMLQSQHIGKIVVSMRTPGPVPVLPTHNSKPLCSPEHTYLITGGLGGFGLATGRWLVKQGARHLALMGRRGAATTEARQAVQELLTAGVDVRVIAADVAKAADVRQVVAEIDGSMPPLKGILHAAGVLDDALLLEQTGESIARVMAPKALGAWHLHQASRHRDLDFFVLFSSISALIGNAGQGNYVAANAFLDALARHRQARGLAGTSVNWGVIGSVGMAARDQGIIQHLARQGVQTIEPDQATATLEPILRSDVAQIGVMNVDWSQWAKVNPTAMTNPRFEHLIAANEGDSAADAQSLVQVLRELEPENRCEMATLLLAELLGETLRLPVDKISLDRPLTEMGLDSLMTVELQTAINMKFGAEFSTMELMQGHNLMQMGVQLLTRLHIDCDSTTVPGRKTVTDPTRSLDEMNEAEIDELLDEMLVEETRDEN